MAEFYIEAPVADEMGQPSARWRVIPERNLLQLQRPGHPACNRQLEPRLMQLLGLLAHAHGAVLSRESLMEALWPRVVVNENSLTRAVSELRKAFVKNAEAAELNINNLSGLIETVPKRGYRLNAPVSHAALQAESASVTVPEAEHCGQPDCALASVPLRANSYRRASGYPAMAAAIIISAAMSSFWTLKLSSDPSPAAMLAGSSVPVSGSSAAWAAGVNADDKLLNPAGVSATNQLEDRVIGDMPQLPDGLQWVESAHINGDGYAAQAANITHSVLAPGGKLIAYVEQQPGNAQLRLRSLNAPDEAWTVFSSNQPITHLQWSPLDAGLLFTVQSPDNLTTAPGQGAALNTQQRHDLTLTRLMLLDLDTLQLKELHRREIPADHEQVHTIGSLT